jgi:hypothetical protein
LTHPSSRCPGLSYLSAAGSGKGEQCKQSNLGKIHDSQPNRTGHDRNEKGQGGAPAAETWNSTKKVRHGPKRQKRRTKRWNRKSPGCQLKRQHKNAAIEGRSYRKTRRRIQLKKMAFCVRREQPLPCRMSLTVSTGRKLKPSFQGLTLKKGKLDLKEPYKKG